MLKTAKIMKKTATLLLFFIVSTISYSNDYKKDREIFNNYIEKFKDMSLLSDEQLIIETAKFFIGTPYVAHTLEKSPESLVINLREMDCTTFVENVFALVKTIKDWSKNPEGDPLFESFAKNLQLIRYRDGVLDDYSSRLHYTTEWISNNETKGLVKDITKDAGGIEHIKQLNIMSLNKDKYKQLSGDEPLTSKIIEIEKRASKRVNYRIPAESIEQNRASFKNGDMVGFVTSTKGIDLSHVGIIYFEGERLTFIHASSTEKRVVIEKLTLEDYCKKSKTNQGIMVVRALFCSYRP